VAKVLRKPEAKIADNVVKRIGNGTILDLGSGTGYLSIEIAKRSAGLQVCGIDLSRQMVKIAKRRGKGIDNARFVFGNAARLPFKGSSVDLVVSTGVFHHLKTPRLVFEECYRILKAGGEAWIFDGCPEVFEGKADRRRFSREYGFLIGHFGHTVSAIHGSARQEYESDIKGMLEQTRFKHSYNMALTDIWMKITLKKRQ